MGVAYYYTRSTSKAFFSSCTDVFLIIYQTTQYSLISLISAFDVQYVVSCVVYRPKLVSCKLKKYFPFTVFNGASVKNTHFYCPWYVVLEDNWHFKT